MITKTQFTNSLIRELEIIRHLAEKVKESDLDYRPTEGQRTVRELLQFMTYIFGTGVEALVTSNQELYRTRRQNLKEFVFQSFNQDMKDEEKKIKELLGNLTDADLEEEIDNWGVAPRGIHLMMVLKWAAAYKMQLFLYLKAAGHSELVSANLWRGVDPESKK